MSVHFVTIRTPVVRVFVKRALFGAHLLAAFNQSDFDDAPIISFVTYVELSRLIDLGESRYVASFSLYDPMLVRISVLQLRPPNFNFIGLSHWSCMDARSCRHKCLHILSAWAILNDACCYSYN